jgi:hypothetical protein
MAAQAGAVPSPRGVLQPSSAAEVLGFTHPSPAVQANLAIKRTLRGRLPPRSVRLMHILRRAGPAERRGARSRVAAREGARRPATPRAFLALECSIVRHLVRALGGGSRLSVEPHAFERCRFLE